MGPLTLTAISVDAQILSKTRRCFIWNLLCNLQFSDVSRAAVAANWFGSLRHPWVLSCLDDWGMHHGNNMVLSDSQEVLSRINVFFLIVMILIVASPIHPYCLLPLAASQ